MDSAHRHFAEPKPLISPPEMAKSLDSFSTPTSKPAMPIFTPLSAFARVPYPSRSLPMPHPSFVSRHRDANDTDNSTLPPSPPASLSEHKDKHDESDELRDPELFSHDDSTNSDFPLFPLEPLDRENAAVAGAIAEHIRNSAPRNHPTVGEYTLFYTTVAQGYNRDPKAWMARERDLLKLCGRKGSAAKQATLTSPKAFRKLAPMPSSGVVKKQRPIAIPKLPRVARAPRQPCARDTPKSQVSDSFDVYDSPPLKVKAPTSRDDVDYQSLPDFSPPLSTLSPNNSKALNVDWRNGIIDLSGDLDRHLLHEAEVYCASRLRLSCATYLCSKRRIFQARINALRIGKEFRKTDAQQACKIDVNKASKLWTAFEKVGWFEAKWFDQYI